MVRRKEAESVKNQKKHKSVAQHNKDNLGALEAELKAKLAWIQGKSGMPERDLAVKAVQGWLNVIRELSLCRKACIPTAN